MEEKIPGIGQIGLSLASTEGGGGCGDHKTNLHLVQAPQSAHFGEGETYDFRFAGSVVVFVCLSATKDRMFLGTIRSSSEFFRAVQGSLISSA